MGEEKVEFNEFKRSMKCWWRNEFKEFYDRFTVKRSIIDGYYAEFDKGELIEVLRPLLRDYDFVPLTIDRRFVWNPKEGYYQLLSLSHIYFPSIEIMVELPWQEELYKEEIPGKIIFPRQQYINGREYCFVLKIEHYFDPDEHYVSEKLVSINGTKIRFYCRGGHPLILLTNDGWEECHASMFSINDKIIEYIISLL